MKKFLISIMTILIMFFPTISAYANTYIVEDKTEASEEIIDLTANSSNFFRETQTFNKNSISEYIKLHPSQKSKIVSAVKNGNEICSLVNYDYYISEKYDKYGNVIDSHLMTKDEVDIYKNELKERSVPFYVSNMTTKAYGLIDSDFEEKGKLSIGLVVTKNSDNTYTAFGNAKWNTTSIVGGANYPDAAGADFFSITWGGNGELKCTKASASGSYNNGTSISISRAKSDTYKGYCWQFLEKKSGTGSCMKNLSAEVNLKKTYSKNRNKETNVICTYIHTYSKVTGSISFNAGKNNLAGGITLGTTEKQWQISCDVSGVKY